MKKYQIIYADPPWKYEDPKGNLISISNKCCCCGGVVVVNYKKGDEVARAFAEECDVCTECFKAGCRVLTGENCKVTGKGQVQLSSRK